MFARPYLNRKNVVQTYHPSQGRKYKMQKITVKASLTKKLDPISKATMA
jgi:hypothetical protein